MMRRLIGVLVAALAVWLGLACPGYAAAVPTAASPQVHAYDVQQQAAPGFEHASERGPPSTTTSHTKTTDAVDLRSPGSSARPGGTAPAAAFAYDRPALLVQAARNSGTTSGDAAALSGDSSSLQRWRVAANTGPRALSVGPWGQKIVDARTRLPGAWGPGTPNAKGVGTRWFDPANKGSGVRIDQGIPGSSYASQQVDHVVVRSGGRILGPDGKPIVGPLSQNPQAHIPLSDWLTWSSWSTP